MKEITDKKSKKKPRFFFPLKLYVRKYNSISDEKLIEFRKKSQVKFLFISNYQYLLHFKEFLLQTEALFSG